MKGHTLHLSNSHTIDTDAVIFATGWQLAHQDLFDPSLAADLGIPIRVNQQSPAHRQYWSNLDKAAEQRILSQYPILAQPPPHLNLESRPPRTSTPLRHFRLLAPPALCARHDRSIVFLGNLVIGQVSTYAEVSALWSVAYLEDRFPSGSPLKMNMKELLDDRKAMERDVAAANAYFKLRYVDLLEIPLAIFEMREVIDRLLVDLGLRADRHGMKVSGGGWWGWWGWRAWVKEWFTPYVPADYRGIVGEFVERVGRE